MQIRSLCGIPVEADEPVAAIRQFVRTLRKSAVPTDKTRVEIRLTGMSARASAAIREFNPDRTEGASFERSLAIVEELTLLPAAKLKSLMFTLSAQDFLWRGASTESSGKLHLFDGKVFHQKQRFGLSGMLDFNVPDARAKEVAEMLASVSKECGLSFSIQGSSVLFEPSDAQATQEQLLVTQLAWNELIRDVGQKLRPQFDVLALPQVMGSSASISYRFNPAKLGKSVRVDFRGITRRWFKESFPDFQPRKADEDDYGIRKTVAEGLHLISYLDKDNGSFSKKFVAKLGIEFTAAQYAPLPTRPYRVETDFLELFGLFMYGWAYFSKEELVSALNAARPVLRTALDLVEEEAHAYLSGALERKLDEFEGPRDLTAKQAYDLVVGAAREWAADAALSSIQLFPVVHNYGTLAVGLPLHSGQGRLGANGEWRFTFLSLSKREHLQFFVPWRGPIRRSRYPFLQGENLSSDPKIARMQGIAPFREGWIDSDRALELALDKLILEGASPVDASFDMRDDWHNGATWRIGCHLKKDGKLNVIHVQVPAYGDGEVRAEVTRYDKNGTPLDL